MKNALIVLVLLAAGLLVGVAATDGGELAPFGDDESEALRFEEVASERGFWYSVSIPVTSDSTQGGGVYANDFDDDGWQDIRRG